MEMSSLQDYQRPVYSIQGMRFQQLPTSRHNVNALQERFSEEDAATLDEYEQYVELLRYIVEPVGDASFERIDLDHLDVKMVERAMGNFLPTLIGISSGLMS